MFPVASRCNFKCYCDSCSSCGKMTRRRQDSSLPSSLGEINRRICRGRETGGATSTSDRTARTSRNSSQTNCNRNNQNISSSSRALCPSNSTRTSQIESQSSVMESQTRIMLNCQHYRDNKKKDSKRRRCCQSKFNRGAMDATTTSSSSSSTEPFPLKLRVNSIENEIYMRKMKTFERKAPTQTCEHLQSTPTVQPTIVVEGERYYSCNSEDSEYVENPASRNTPCKGVDTDKDLVILKLLHEVVRLINRDSPIREEALRVVREVEEKPTRGPECKDNVLKSTPVSWPPSHSCGMGSAHTSVPPPSALESPAVDCRNKHGAIAYAESNKEVQKDSSALPINLACICSQISAICPQHGPLKTLIKKTIHPCEGTLVQPSAATPDRPCGGVPDRPSPESPDRPCPGTPGGPCAGMPDRPCAGTPDNINKGREARPFRTQSDPCPQRKGERCPCRRTPLISDTDNVEAIVMEAMDNLMPGDIDFEMYPLCLDALLQYDDEDPSYTNIITESEAPYITIIMDATDVTVVSTENVTESEANKQTASTEEQEQEQEQEPPNEVLPTDEIVTSTENVIESEIRDSPDVIIENPVSSVVDTTEPEASQQPVPTEEEEPPHEVLQVAEAPPPTENADEPEANNQPPLPEEEPPVGDQIVESAPSEIVRMDEIHSNASLVEGQFYPNGDGPETEEVNSESELAKEKIDESLKRKECEFDIDHPDSNLALATLAQVGGAGSPEEMKFFINSLLVDLDAMDYARRRSRFDKKICKQIGLCARDSFPVTITEVTDLGANSLYVKWSIHSHSGIAGYEIYTDGYLTNRYYNGNHDAAVITNVDVTMPHKVGLVAQPIGNDQAIDAICKKAGDKNRRITDLEKNRNSHSPVWTPSIFLYDPGACKPFAEPIMRVDM